ncbi:MAPK regulated corepressor interacting protein 2-like [Styela clava]
MHTYISSKPATKINSLRNRPIVHSHQEKRPVAQSPVEFRDNLCQQDTCPPKLIFGQGLNVSPMNRSHSPITPQHENNIKFVKEEWEKVKADLNNTDTQQQRKGCVQYVERHECINPDFQPFDLEEFWGERLLRKVLDSDTQ